MPNDWTDRIDDEIDRLRQTRDELRVQMHLAAAEAREGWETLERSWHQLEQRMKRIEDATQEASDDVEGAVRLLLQELKLGYEKIQAAF